MKQQKVLMKKQGCKDNYKPITHSKSLSSRKEKRISLSLKGLRNITHSLLKKNSQKSMKSTKQDYKIKNRTVSTFKINSLVCDENFKCPICLGCIIKPIITQCGHSYCYDCADQAMPNQGICCVCRQTVDDSLFKIHKQMQAILKNYISTKSTLEQKLNYLERQKQFEDFQRKRKIPLDIFMGDCVDFRIKNIWKEGVILEVTNTAVAVGCKNNSDKKIIFQRNSRNIAKFRTFTKEKSQNIIDRVPIMSQIPIAQNVEIQGNVDNEIFWEFAPVIINSSIDSWMFEQQDYFPQANNNLVWGAIY